MPLDNSLHDPLPKGTMKPIRSLATLALAALACILLAQPASAAPVTGLASSTALPTAQITGIVWASVTVGDTVYATGSFTRARPAGVAPGGPGEVTRNNIVAFSITTGTLTGFAPSLDGEGRAITASADGTRLFVGGKFSTVNGAPRSRLAAFALPSGALLSSYATGPVGASAKVLSLAAAENGKLYVGGAFSKVGTTARTNLAAYTAAGALDPFYAKANSQVTAMVLTPDGSRLVAGGSFDTVAGPQTPGGWPAYGLAAFSTANAEPVLSWASTRADFPIHTNDVAHTSTAITSLATDGEKVYGSAFNDLHFMDFGDFEGTFAIEPNGGNLVWMNNCHGDTYGIFPMRGVLYSVSHAHDCTAVGAYPETSNPRTWHRANASTTTVDGVNVCWSPPYWCYAGYPRSTILLDFAPKLNTGTYSGAVGVRGPSPVTPATWCWAASSPR